MNADLVLTEWVQWNLSVDPPPGYGENVPMWGHSPNNTRASNHLSFLCARVHCADYVVFAMLWISFVICRKLLLLDVEFRRRYCTFCEYNKNSVTGQCQLASDSTWPPLAIMVRFWIILVFYRRDFGIRISSEGLWLWQNEMIREKWNTWRWSTRCLKWNIPLQFCINWNIFLQSCMQCTLSRYNRTHSARILGRWW